MEGDEIATERATELRDNRGACVANMMQFGDAVTLAAASPGPVIFAYVADNPGGGRGNTSFILRAFHEAKTPDAAPGVFVDPETVWTPNAK